MTFEIRFEPNPHGALALREDAFRLYESGGHYVLPNLVLFSPRDRGGAMLTDLHVEAVGGVHGPLQSWLQNEWLTGPLTRRPIAGPVVLTEARDAIPAVIVDASLDPGNPKDASRGRVSVTWTLSGTDLAGNPITGDSRNVVLDFAPSGTVSGPESEAPPTIVIRHRTEPWLDTRAAVDFAAVDFGTSSSTVTLRVGEKRKTKLDTAQTKYLARMLAKILRARPEQDSVAEAEWQDVIPRVESALAERFPDYAAATLSETADKLSSDTASDELVFAVCEELDRALGRAHDELGRWLAQHLHTALDTAYRIPALDSLRLEPVLFDRLNDLYDKPSALVVTDPENFETAIQADAGGAAGRVFRDLKRGFARGDDVEIDGLHTRDGAAVQMRHLVAAYYDHLVYEAEEFVANGDDNRRGSLPRLVLTYPTTTTPQNRRRLERLVRQALGVKRVDTTYDEGVAAGLYFLMRDFGGVGAQSIGVEALRADSMPVTSSRHLGVEPGGERERIAPPRSWRQVMLVLDIGAGTTDIALIGLNLRDITSQKNDVAAEVRGRYYLIEPEVLGSTGDDALGGDSLTLRVFYWIKAAILDAMAARGGKGDVRNAFLKSLPSQFRPDEQRADLCAQEVISSNGREPAPESILGELRGKLDTTFEPGSESLAFRYLWNAAEQAKIVLGQGKSHVISKTTITEILGAIGDKDVKLKPLVDDYEQLVPETGIALDPASFERLVRPLLIRAVDLAHHLAKIRLPKLEGGRLDRVMLSGKTSQMPLVARVVEERMTRRAADYLPVEQRDRQTENHSEEEADESTAIKQPRVDVETVFAKQAASLGACWAAAVKEFGSPTPDTDEIDKGRTELGISVDNLFTAVPSNFTYAGADLPMSVFDIGTPFTELDGRGTLGIRTRKWVPLPETYELLREIGPDQSRRWGHYVFQDHADENGYELDEPIWRPVHGMIPTMTAQLELDQACAPKLYLCNRGTPYYVSRGNPITLGQQYLDTDNQLTRLPKIVVRTGRKNPDDKMSHGDAVTERPVCEAREFADDAGIAATFPLHVHTEDDPDSSVVTAFDVALPPVSARYPSYQFFVVGPDGKDEYINELAAPGPPSPRARYRVTVTRTGVLRVHRGELPYLSAHSLADVEKRRGTVLAVALKERPEAPPTNWLPFDGTH